jgi:hypothetical protein
MKIVYCSVLSNVLFWILVASPSNALCVYVSCLFCNTVLFGLFICVLFGVNNLIYPFFIHVSPLDKHGFWGKHLNKVYINTEVYYCKQRLIK